MATNLIRLPIVKEKTGLARSTIYLLMSQSRFPQSISLGDRAVAWISEEIDEWIEQRIEMSRSSVAKQEG